ncbi:hypothetical protein [Okeania sp. SIO2C2]|uniref:hypothetical protein n=1 Tax=Okeania sp. SIO2C2 TaxID=2607787 RepID=UPI00257E547F|nr:hypothetical protein [Okeania sp. SIO2C2]
MLQIARIFLRSQSSGVRSQNEWFKYHFLGRKSFFSLGALPGATVVVAGSHRFVKVHILHLYFYSSYY